MENEKNLDDKFNLEDFYINNKEAAIIIVSDDKYIGEYSPEGHEKVAQNIIESIDPTFKMFYSQSNICWQNQATNRGILCIQLCSSCQSLIWLPNEINEFQYQYLVKFNTEFNKIKEKYNLSDNFNIYSILNMNNKNTMVNLNSSLNIIKDNILKVSEEDQAFNYR